MAHYQSTAEIIRDIANDLRHRADKLDSYAKKLLETDDLDYVSMAISDATSTANMRLDLLITRPVRDLTKALESQNKEAK